MNFTLPDHIRLLRESLRRFVAREMPRSEAARWDRDNLFPRAVFDRLGEMGVMGLTVPEAHGGTGRDTLATMVVIEELSRRSMAVAVPYIMAACYAGLTLVECGSEEQKSRLLPQVAAGRMMFAYGWSEPDVGADVASVGTRAVRDGDSVVVNGAKRFCSGAEYCDYIYTLVRTDAAERYGNLAFVLIPPTAPGVTIERMGSMGLKGVPTTDVRLVDVRVPLADLMGGADGWNRGWDMITGIGLDVEKIEVAALALGIASAAFDDAWDYSRQRQQFGQPIANYQAIRHKLADMRTQIEAARLMLYQSAWLVDQPGRHGLQTSMAKLFVTEAAKTVVLEAQSILGAYGYVREFDMERYVRDILLMPIIGGSSAIQRNNIAKWAGLDRGAA